MSITLFHTHTVEVTGSISRIAHQASPKRVVLCPTTLLSQLAERKAMCGRFTLKAPPRSIKEHFHLPEEIDLPPRYNIAPSQNIAVVRHLTGKDFRQLDMLRWGLIPHWAKDMKIGYRMINARGETLTQKPSFSTAFKIRRCLIAADGFYEWKVTGKIKQPYYMQIQEEDVFGFAGLWESWLGPEGDIIESCTIITTSPNELVKQVHDRMPAILPPGHYETWLQNSSPLESLQKLLVPYPADKIKMYKVSTEVNNPQNDQATCLVPV